MEHVRKVFEDATRLMAKFNALKDDIRGIARREQLTISASIAALPFPQVAANSDEWHIAMTSGMYHMPDRAPISEYWTDDMEAHQLEMAHLCYLEEQQAKTERAALYVLFPDMDNPDGTPLDDVIPF